MDMDHWKNKSGTRRDLHPGTSVIILVFFVFKASRNVTPFFPNKKISFSIVQ